jgi:hypothetical protein
MEKKECKSGLRLINLCLMFKKREVDLMRKLADGDGRSAVGIIQKSHRVPFC